MTVLLCPGVRMSRYDAFATRLRPEVRLFDGDVAVLILKVDVHLFSCIFAGVYIWAKHLE